MQWLDFVRGRQPNDLVRAKYIRSTMILVSLNGVHCCTIVIDDIDLVAQLLKAFFREA